MTKAPVFFISHGAPTFALEPGQLGARLRQLGQQLNGVKAVLVVSPHWQTRDLKVMGTAQPETVHDFGGFPAALYDLQYPVAGDAALAQAVGEQLAQAGWPVSYDTQRGLDHGAWVPLLHLRPAADIPSFQVSLPLRLDTAAAFRLGRSLAPLRDKGVMVVGSGSMTHNLFEFRQGGAAVEDYAVEFTHWVRQTVQNDDEARMTAYRQLAPHAQRAHPTEEHFLPLLVAMGAHAPDEAAQVISGDITHGVLSMESYAWGLPQGVALSTDDRLH